MHPQKIPFHCFFSTDVPVQLVSTRILLVQVVNHGIGTMPDTSNSIGAFLAKMLLIGRS